MIGFMGCGKSSVGRELSSRLRCPFVDLDAELERRSDMSIAEIFARYGESEFRKRELATLEEVLLRQEDFILATGGGTPMIPEASALLSGKTYCVYLRACALQLEEILASLDNTNRPLLKTSSVTELLRARVPVYERTAHLTLDISEFASGIPDANAFARMAGRLVLDIGKEKGFSGH